MFRTPEFVGYGATERGIRHQGSSFQGSDIRHQASGKNLIPDPCLLIPDTLIPDFLIPGGGYAVI
jgi:hypothetical protein